MWHKYAIFGSGEGTANSGQGYYPEDIGRAYDMPTDLDGSGQSTGILEFSNGFSLSDAQAFWRMHDIDPPKVQFISVDGTRNDHGQSSADQEASLDLQWAGAIAPVQRYWSTKPLVAGTIRVFPPQCPRPCAISSTTAKTRRRCSRSRTATRRPASAMRRSRNGAI